MPYIPDWPGQSRILTCPGKYEIVPEILKNKVDRFFKTK